MQGCSCSAIRRRVMSCKRRCLHELALLVADGDATRSTRRRFRLCVADAPQSDHLAARGQLALRKRDVLTVFGVGKFGERKPARSLPDRAQHLAQGAVAAERSSIAVDQHDTHRRRDQKMVP